MSTSSSPRSVTTGEFRIGRYRIVRRMALRHTRVLLASLGAALAVTTVLAFTADIRWVAVALMLVAIVAPMMLALLYFNYGLRRETVVNILPHRVTISAGEAVVTLYISDAAEEVEKPDRWELRSRELERKYNPDFGNDAAAEEADSSEDDDTEANEPTREVVYRFELRADKPFSAGLSTLTLFPAPPAKGIIEVPYNAFASAEELEAAIEILSGHSGQKLDYETN